ncbi:LacI family DNA-binding transcriptional regulator [Amycolatopsis jejuensis]|uniref:LacI family DNA-binding transcriptional regulator n=1 Tax=Amycolatopsis jejuensis TaxID=330084 RepID=UPI00052726DA|nr:LacI family DNA-binding transcriptional regulator [Amycolatopsis jejuensis]
MTAMPPGRRPSTIRDVAALAGVSKSTASRAVLGHGGVSPENLEKVRRAIEQLDFVPNQIARNLTARSSAILGLFLRQTRSPFYASLAGAFEETAGDRGYEVMSLASGDQPDEANYRSLMLLADMRTAGIVVAAPTVDPRTIRQVASRVPLVLVGQMGQPANPGVPFVAPDPREAQALIDHVTGYGHRSIALLAYSPEQSPTQWARIAWMRDELDRAGLLSDLVMINPDDNLAPVVEQLYRTGTTAILCNNDWTALDALAAAAHLGISIPGELSIAGYDGIPPFDHEAVGLTTNRVPVNGMADAAVRLIDDLIHDNHVETGGILLRGELVVGRTTGPAQAR